MFFLSRVGLLKIRRSSRLDTGDGSGNFVSIQGASGVRYYYGHLDTIGVVDEQPITKGQQIGTVGETGNALCSDPHLHFELKPDGETAIDPNESLMAWPLVGGTAPPASVNPTGTLTSMTGAAGTGTVLGTVTITGYVGAIGIRATVDGGSQSPVASAGGSGARSYEAPFTAGLTSAHRICVQAYNGSASQPAESGWHELGCLNTAQGFQHTFAGSEASGRVQGPVSVTGWAGGVQVRALVNGVAQAPVYSSAGLYDAPFATSGSSAHEICMQGNSYGYWKTLG